MFQPLLKPPPTPELPCISLLILGLRASGRAVRKLIVTLPPSFRLGAALPQDYVILQWSVTVLSLGVKIDHVV